MRGSLPLAFGVCLGAGLTSSAAAQPVDLTGAPASSPVAAVHVYPSAVDLTDRHLPMIGGGADNSAQTVSMLVSTGGSAALDYTAAVLDRDSGDNLFIKVQGQNASGKFNSIGFYHGNNGGGWPGMVGGAAFFILPAADEFTSARMRVTHDGAGGVTLTLTEVVGGTNPQIYMRGGWVPRAGASAGGGGFSGNYPTDNFGVAFTGDEVCDTFNRANGPMGPDWVFVDGTGSIDVNAAKFGANSRGLYIGCCGSIVQEAAADIAVVPPSTLTYGSLVLNNDGTNNLYIKVQRQGLPTTFTHIGFYEGNNGGGWAGLSGGASFFALAAGDEFSNARMRVSLYTNGVVRLVLSNIDGSPTGVQEYQRGGWSVLAGGRIGFGGFDGDTAVDNFAANCGLRCDRFNRPDGPLGPNWATSAGGAAIVSNTARGGVGGGASRSEFLGTCQVCYPDCNGDGNLNIFDFTCYQASFVAGCP